MSTLPSFFERKWKRPDSVAPFPNIWNRFSVKSRDGRCFGIRIQDMMPDQRNEVWRMYEEQFYQDDEISRVAEMVEDEPTLNSLRWLFDQCVKENLSVVAVLDNSDPKPVIVGALKLIVASKDDPPTPTLPGEAHTKVCDLFKKVRGDINVFERLKIDHCFQENGLVVAREYRRLGIGTELFKTIERMAKTFNVHAAGVSLSNMMSQAIGVKLGYSVLSEQKLRDYVDENGYMILPVANAREHVVRLCYKLM